MSYFFKMITINGQDLSISDIVQVAYYKTPVMIAPENEHKVRKTSEFIQTQVKEKNIIYGVTTGFGINANKVIQDAQKAIDLQHNLIISHACGVGQPLAVPVVRAMMLIRLNTLLAGHSGIRWETIHLLLELLNKDILPMIPSQGSVGASGDLCPLSHMALPLIGVGEVSVLFGDSRRLIPAVQALSEAGLSPIELSYKEGLALINGTTLMAALGALAVHKAEKLVEKALESMGVAFEALGVRRAAFDERIHRLRRHEQQAEVAKKILDLTKGSTFFNLSSLAIVKKIAEDTDEKRFAANPQAYIEGLIEKLSVEEKKGVYSKGTILNIANRKTIPQDAYSIRCTPQVVGASLQAIRHVRMVISQELNAVTDNPLIFEEEVLSGGNFHGQPLALALDYLKLGVAEIGNFMERQINKIVDPATNDFLPAFLAEDIGLHSGLMIPQYAAASLVSENKVLVHPASADSIPTSANQEDHVSMGTIAGRQALEIIENVEKIAAIHILTAVQALDLRTKQLKNIGFNCIWSENAQKMAHWVRTELNIPFLDKDRFLHPDIQTILVHLQKSILTL